MVNRIKDEILRYFPGEIRESILLDDRIKLNDVCEIRLRVNRPVILKDREKEYFVEKNSEKCVISKEIVRRVFESICSNSVYAFEEEISNGFITIFGGHRVGISGKPLYKDGRIYSIKDISGLNFRVARQLKGVADDIISKIKINGEFVNTLIISPPGLGKTTLLRDLVRQISDIGYNISLVDERSEIASCFLGIPQNDIGIRTDVMDLVRKSDGIKMMVRSMRPDFIATDEIGTDDDASAIEYAINSGVKILATAHGSKQEDLYKSTKMKELLKWGAFKKIILLSKGKIDVLEGFIGDKEK